MDSKANLPELVGHRTSAREPAPVEEGPLELKCPLLDSQLVPVRFDEAARPDTWPRCGRSSKLPPAPEEDNTGFGFPPGVPPRSPLQSSRGDACSRPS